MTELLVELDGLLRENDIKYMLYSGSQLGADRHHGMIPWDDDIDIMMSLENYDRFIELARRGLPEGRSINALELSTDYPLCYGRYVDLTTTALQRHTIFGGCDPGVKIDVFFCVPTHPNEKKAKKHQLEILAFNEVITDNISMNYRRPEEFFSYYEKEKKLFNRLGKDAYVRKRLPELKYKYAGGFRKPAQYIFFSGMLGNSHFFSASEINNTKEIDFEGHKLFAAANGPYFNIESYGESWYQIPDNISKPHHTWAADINVPFSEYMATIGDSFELDKIHELQRRRKQLKLEEQVRFKDAIILKERLKNLALGMSVETGYRERESELTLQESFELFRPYYSSQLSKANRWYSLEVPLPADILSKALITLAAMGDFPKVRSILNIVDNKNLDCMDELKKQTELSRQLLYAVYVYPSQLESKELLIKQNEGTINLSVPEAKGRLMLQRMRQSGNADERREIAESIVELADSNVQIYGERSELMILKAFAVKELEEQCKWQGALTSEDLFNMDIDSITNGFILQEIIDEGYDIIHNADPDEDCGGETTPEPGVRHFYLEEQEYSEKKRVLEGSAGVEVKYKGEDEYIIEYKDIGIASSVWSALKKKKNDIQARTYWHLCGPGEMRTELKKVALFADNLTVEDYLRRAEKEGLLSERSQAGFAEYRKWLREEYSNVNSQYMQFSREFTQYMSQNRDK